MSLHKFEFRAEESSDDLIIHMTGAHQCTDVVRAVYYYLLGCSFSKETILDAMTDVVADNTEVEEKDPEVEDEEAAKGVNKSDTLFIPEFSGGGLEWSTFAKKEMTHYEAESYAKSIGARLPTIEEIKALYKSKPETLKDQSFWSSSVHPNDPYFAFYFNGYFGYVGYGYRDSDKSVRCVRAVPACESIKQGDSE